jgi:hypothetical protein
MTIYNDEAPLSTEAERYDVAAEIVRCMWRVCQKDAKDGEKEAAEDTTRISAIANGQRMTPTAALAPRNPQKTEGRKGTVAALRPSRCPNGLGSLLDTLSERDGPSSRDSNKKETPRGGASRKG